MGSINHSVKKFRIDILGQFFSIACIKVIFDRFYWNSIIALLSSKSWKFNRVLFFKFQAILSQFATLLSQNFAVSLEGSIYSASYSIKSNMGGKCTRFEVEYIEIKLTLSNNQKINWIKKKGRQFFQLPMFQKSLDLYSTSNLMLIRKMEYLILRNNYSKSMSNKNK